MYSRSHTPTRQRTLNALALTGMAAVAMTMTTPTVEAGGWPKVMSQMPADTQIAIGAESFSMLDQHWSLFIKTIELDVLGVPNPSDALMNMGPSAQYIDKTQSFGIAFVKDQWEAEFPPLLVYLPVSDYTGWVESLSTGEENGLHLLDLGDGEDWYARHMGSYAVMGLNSELVSECKPGTGNMKKFQALAGDLGTSVITKNDIVAFIDMEGLDAVVAPKLDEMMAGFEDGLQMAQMYGGGFDIDQARSGIAYYRAALELSLEEGQCAVFGARTGTKGIVIDTAMQWKPESKLAKLFAGTKKPRNLLDRFDPDSYMMAMSIDFKGLDFEGLFSMLKERVPEDLQEFQSNSPTSAWDIWNKADGFGFVLYPSPGGLMGGLFNAAVTVMTGDVPAMRAGMEKTFAEMNEMEMNGITYTTEYGKDAAQIDDLTVDTYSMQMRFPPELAQAQQGVTMMYGPAGLRGYVVPTDDALIQTMSRNKVIVRKMLTAQNGENVLSQDATLKTIDNLFPANPAVRGYIGIGAIVSQVSPMVGMFLQGVDFDVMSDVPPIAFASSISNGGVHKTLVIPAPLIKSVSEVVMQIQQSGLMYPGGDMEGEPAEDDMF